MSTHRLIVLFAAALVVAACKNPNYCAGNPEDDCRLRLQDSGPDATKVCTGDSDCMAPTGVCDLTGMKSCVQCTSSDNPCATLTPAAPACVANQCQKCTAHTQCPTSNACLPDGSCADPAQVAYVQSGGTGAVPCTKAAPCGTLDDGVKANKPTVKIAAGIVADMKTTTIDGVAVTILGDPGAKLDRTGDGIILEVKNNGANVAIYDLEISGATGMVTDAAISMPNGGAPKLTLTRVTVDGNQGVGISASAGTLTVSKCTVITNTGGGISISGAQFDISNSIIAKNGSGATALGGLQIAGITTTGTHVLDFNTISDNLGPATIDTGVACGTVLVPLKFSNNIIYANIVSGGGTQIGGSPNCTTTYSDVGPDAVTGTGDINMDPMFVNAAQGNFHLMNSSPVKDTADPSATLADDIDGDVRPQGPRRDMGADEVKP